MVKKRYVKRDYQILSYFWPHSCPLVTQCSQRAIGFGFPFAASELYLSSLRDHLAIEGYLLSVYYFPPLSSDVVVSSIEGSCDQPSAQPRESVFGFLTQGICLLQRITWESPRLRPFHFLFVESFASAAGSPTFVFYHFILRALLRPASLAFTSWQSRGLASLTSWFVPRSELAPAPGQTWLLINRYHQPISSPILYIWTGVSQFPILVIELLLHKAASSLGVPSSDSSSSYSNQEFPFRIMQLFFVAVQFHPVLPGDDYWPPVAVPQPRVDRLYISPALTWSALSPPSQP